MIHASTPFLKGQPLPLHLSNFPPTRTPGNTGIHSLREVLHSRAMQKLNTEQTNNMKHHASATSKQQQAEKFARILTAMGGESDNEGLIRAFRQQQATADGDKSVKATPTASPNGAPAADGASPIGLATTHSSTDSEQGPVTPNAAASEAAAAAAAVATEHSSSTITFSPSDPLVLDAYRMLATSPTVPPVSVCQKRLSSTQASQQLVLAGFRAGFRAPCRPAGTGARAGGSATSIRAVRLHSDISASPVSSTVSLQNTDTTRQTRPSTIQHSRQTPQERRPDCQTWRLPPFPRAACPVGLTIPAPILQSSCKPLCLPGCPACLVCMQTMQRPQWSSYDYHVLEKLYTGYASKGELTADCCGMVLGRGVSGCLGE